ncbi:MAG: beta-lactamase family protein [Bacteroidales bacterium]|nr:beta-lactamase family protein [Bacteroidales bacterium]
MKRTLTLIIITLLMTACTNNKVKKIDAICSELFPADEPGAAVLVMKGDKIIFDKGYGISDIKTKAPIDGNTFFNIASVSKQFTAVAALKLAQDGKISLDDSVKKYFPYFKADFFNDIKLKHLLSHSSGIPDTRPRTDRNFVLFGTDKECIQYMADLDSLNFAPGTNYEYINPTFQLFYTIIENVSGETFEQFVQKNIFDKAGMTQTTYFEPDKVIPNMAHGYEYEDVSNGPEERISTKEDLNNKKGKKWYEFDYGEETFFATKADGGIYSSTHEFVKWEKALRNNTIISEESKELAQSPHTKVSGSSFSSYQNQPNISYGYGWFIDETPGKTKTIYHTGDNGGFKILACRYPEKELLILVFANRADWDRTKLRHDLENVLLEDK